MKKLRGMRKQQAIFDCEFRYCGVVLAVGGSAILGAGASIYSAKKSAKAAETAATAQSASADKGIEEQRRQFDIATDVQNKRYTEATDIQNKRYADIQALLQPFVGAGTGALTGQQNILGLNGTQAQNDAYMDIQNSPGFAAMARQGEDAILQNASATGGLRGGNTQGALAQFRPQLLNQLIEQQYQRLGGLTSIGQNAAVGVGNAGMQSGQSIANFGMQSGQNIANAGIQTGRDIAGLYGQQGAAQAGSALAQGQAYGQMAGGVANAFGNVAGAYTGMKLGGYKF